MLFYLVPFLFLLAVSGHSYASDEYVKELTIKNFKSFVHKSKYPVAVKFYAPWCGHCKNLVPEYSKAAAKSRAYARFHAVNCDETANNYLCQKYQVKGFPTIKMFLNEKDSQGEKKAVDYNGGRNAKMLLKGIEQNLLNTVTILKNSVSSFDEFVQKDSTPAAVLFTDKKSVPKMWKGIALGFDERLKLGIVNAKHKDVIEHFQISKLPAILVFTSDYTKADIETAHKFSGDFDYENIVSFLKQYSLKSTSAKNKDKDSSGGKNKGKGSDKKKALNKTRRNERAVLTTKEENSAGKKAGNAPTKKPKSKSQKEQGKPSGKSQSNESNKDEL